MAYVSSWGEADPEAADEIARYLEKSRVVEWPPSPRGCRPLPRADPRLTPNPEPDPDLACEPGPGVGDPRLPRAADHGMTSGPRGHWV